MRKAIDRIVDFLWLVFLFGTPVQIIIEHALH